MRFTLDQIDVFVTCADAGSFSAAARRLRRSQSTVSEAIATLEAGFGTPLFDRSTKMPTLTDAGITLLTESRDLLDRALTLESHADSLAQGNPSQITIAIDVPYHLLVGALGDFAARYPHVDLVVRHPSHGDLPQLVLDDQAALGVSLGQPRYDHRLEFRTLGELVLCHVAHRNHPLATGAEVSFATLQAYRHLAHSKHSLVLPTTEYLQSVQTWHADDYAALIHMVRANLGWATVPRQLVLEPLATGEFVELDLTAYPYTDYWVKVDLLWRRSEPQGEAVRVLRDRLAREKLFEPSGRGPRRERHRE